MQTKFDHITDDQIDAALTLVDPTVRYDDLVDDLDRLAHLAWWMAYMRAWIGWPVTYFKEIGTDFDGQHRVRIVKFLARRKDIQIIAPVRYDRAA